MAPHDAGLPARVNDDRPFDFQCVEEDIAK